MFDIIIFCKFLQKHIEFGNTVCVKCRVSAPARLPVGAPERRVTHNANAL